MVSANVAHVVDPGFARKVIHFISFVFYLSRCFATISFFVCLFFQLLHFTNLITSFEIQFPVTANVLSLMPGLQSVEKILTFAVNVRGAILDCLQEITQDKGLKVSKMFIKF